MDVIRIKGGRPLKGCVDVAGSKNAALPLMAATLLTDQPCTLSNVPDLSDTRHMAQILGHLGASVERLDAHSWRITAQRITAAAPYDLVSKMRAAVCLMGPLVGRLRRADVSLPGGCIIGPRPIDLHLKGFAKLGCEVVVQNGCVRIKALRLRGANLFLGGRHGSTVTGTENMLMAAVRTPGVTCIESAACEPEVEDLCRMLVAMGAEIQGIGSPTLIVEGVDQLKGCTHRVIPDRIEAGTYILAAAITGGDVVLNDVEPRHLSALRDKLMQVGLRLESAVPPKLHVTACDTPRLRSVDIITLPYPGFPTDLQAQICALMAVTPGRSIITERIYPSRSMHISELQRMGADIAIESPNIIIKGGKRLSGAPVRASDLRASAALILAGLAAEGETWVNGVAHLDRGYEAIVPKLQALGAEIERVPQNAMPSLP